MTDHNHALNRTLAHLIRGGMDPEDAAALVAQLRDEARAAAWDDPAARVLAADAQSWHRLRAAVLLTVDDPHVWDSGEDEANVLSAWVVRLAAAATDRARALPKPTLDPETTQPMATLDKVLLEAIDSAPSRNCGGNSGRPHAEHLWDRAGETFFCPGSASAAIPHQADRLSDGHGSAGE